MNSDKVGQHFIFEAHVDPKQSHVLKDVDFLTKAIHDLVSSIDLKILWGPVTNVTIIPTDPSLLETDKDEGGVNIVCQNTTSHISLRTWPLRHRFSFELFYCKDFGTKQITEFFKERLYVVYHWSQDILRFWPQGKWKSEEDTQEEPAEDSIVKLAKER